MKKVKLGKFSFSDPIWKTISDQCKDFISKLLTLDQNARPSAEQALEHPFLKQAHDQIINSLDKDTAIGALNNLKNFNASSKLKQATYAFIAS